MPELLAQLCNSLELGVPLTAVSIVEQQGSTPRTAGARMLVAATGIVAGTVGGGLVEARALEAAAATLADGIPRFVDFDLSGEMAAGADMICGGNLRLFVEPLPADETTLRLFADLRGALVRGIPCLIVTPADDPSGRTLLQQGDVGSLPPALADAMRNASAAKLRAPAVLTVEGRTWVLSPWRCPSRLIIAGGGHVSRPTAQIAALAHFAVTVLDDRPEFAAPERFPWAALTDVTPDFADCFAGRNVTPDTSLVIVTRGHMHDASVLAQALRTDAGYIGMIGSRRKREAVYARMREQGFTDADLSRVHSPIGLSIGAETPEEIAVSIVAELIAERARRN